MESKAKIMGQSHEKRPIELYTFGEGSIPVLLLAGVHGDEIEGFSVAERFMEKLKSGENILPTKLKLYLCRQ